MAQSTFGGARAAGGVVSYSSRGPGVDGGSGPLVVSPLAGIVAGTADEGFGPFSGTSSATPALAGFAARVLSRVNAEGLVWDRDALRAAIVGSARMYKGVPFVDQGHGMPNLERAMELYRERVKETKPAPALDVDGGVGALGVKRKGIYVRGDQDRADLYTINFLPTFSSAWSEADQADYAETLVLRSEATWLSFPPTLFASRSGTTAQFAVDWDALAGQKGERITHVEVRNADTGALRAVIPVTVILPDSTRTDTERTLEVAPNDLERVYVTKPAWATHLLVSRETTSASQTLCGRASAYSPVGVRMASPAGGTWGGAVRSENVYETRGAGVYEIVLEGRSNHTVCPREQKIRVRAKWIQLSATAESVTVAPRAQGADTSAPVAHTVRMRFESLVTPALAGTVELSQPAFESAVTLAPNAATPYEWVGKEIDLSSFDRVSFALDEGDVTRLASLRGYPRFDVALKPVVGNPWPAVLGLAGGTDFSAPTTFPALGLAAAEAKRVIPYVRSFDVGLGGAWGASGTLTLRVRGFEKSAPKITVPFAVTTLRPGNPAAVDGTFQAIAESVSGRALACAFKPAGWSLSVACGSILLP